MACFASSRSSAVFRFKSTRLMISSLAKLSLRSWRTKRRRKRKRNPKPRPTRHSMYLVSEQRLRRRRRTWCRP